MMVLKFEFPLLRTVKMQRRMAHPKQFHLRHLSHLQKQESATRFHLQTHCHLCHLQKQETPQKITRDILSSSLWHSSRMSLSRGSWEM